MSTVINYTTQEGFKSLLIDFQTLETQIENCLAAQSGGKKNRLKKMQHASLDGKMVSS